MHPSSPVLRRAIAALVFSLACLLASSLAYAQGKTYTVTAPDGVPLAVQESGNPDGPPIIFIHGLLGSRLNWDAQVRSPQLQGFRLITYDMRGHGLSGKPVDAASYTDGRRWGDELAAVIEASQANRPVLVGWSLGGVVISNYLAKYGDGRISGAIYVNGVIEMEPGQIVSHPAIYRDLVSPDLKTHLNAVRDFLRLCFHTQPDASTFELLLANAATASWDMQRAVMSITNEVVEGLGKVRVPVLMLYGERDELIHAKLAIARAKTLNPNIQISLYAESGHAPFLEESNRFNTDLAAFVDAAR